MHQIPIYTRKKTSLLTVARKKGIRTAEELDKKHPLLVFRCAMSNCRAVGLHSAESQEGKGLGLATAARNRMAMKKKQ